MCGHGEDGDDEEASKFSSGRDREKLGDVDLLLPGAVLGVEEVEGVLAVLPISSALLDDGHGAPATAARSGSLCLGCWFRKEKEEGRRSSGGGEEKEGES